MAVSEITVHSCSSVPPFEVTYVNDELSQKTLILWGDLKDKLNSNRQSFSFCSFL
ncbi:hypothetical protein HanRHA438_Chr09g0384981 [Helianthus annuus]|nr:hypothetical protein HanIR_Chr09g0402471 [Helianthus annuus]KAJ0541316.1 hypothetical protein HanHA89_Chr09g0327031 [Helianthus annuus]KAJ0706395.1 hypothetical protein HanLR1_Chr09g0306501 [Helianthus annuus]KAJ0710433.1 hypothetical protein HanOQP8_Chr09g0312341 [Helianthus annuus]KAJ0886930.1 hypothetical protein HanRHA438_Chr09g0384981 [Helianthus annuus]